VAILGIDAGGTFTDAALLADGELRSAKLSTQPRRPHGGRSAARAEGLAGTLAEGRRRFYP